MMKALAIGDRALSLAAQPALVTKTDWPVNRECHRQFQMWLVAGGYSPSNARCAYGAAARMALESLTRPYWSMPPEEIIHQAESRLEQRADLRPLTKRAYAVALHKLHEFLLFRRNQRPSSPDPLALPAALAELPRWLSDPLARYLRLQQRRWPERLVRERTRQSFHLLWGLGTFFIEQYHWSDWSELSLRWIDDYVDHGLRRGLAPSTLNDRLITWQTFCRFVLEEGYAVPLSLTHLRLLDMPHRLPRPLSDQQIQQLERCIQSAITRATNDYRRQQALMDRAWFYLLWHCGLRLSEVRYVTTNDLDLEGRKLFVRAGKDRKDRVVYLSDTAVTALREHLAARPGGSTGSVFTLHRRVPSRSALEHRLAVYGQRAGVSVTPHRLRHTFASQMLAAGMPVTSLQRYLGHEQLDTTMIYAQVSDPMLEQDYYRGIITVDPLSAHWMPAATQGAHRAELRRLVARLKRRKLTAAERKEILNQMQHLLKEPEPS